MLDKAGHPVVNPPDLAEDAHRHAALAGAALAHGPSVPLPGAAITGLPANGGR